MDAIIAAINTKAQGIIIAIIAPADNLPLGFFLLTIVSLFDSGLDSGIEDALVVVLEVGLVVGLVIGLVVVGVGIGVGIGVELDDGLVDGIAEEFEGQTTLDLSLSIIIFS